MMPRFLNVPNHTKVTDNIFENYEENTVEPGGLLLIILILYCFMSIYIVPLAVIILGRIKQRRIRQQKNVHLNTSRTVTLDCLHDTISDLKNSEPTLKKVETGETKQCLIDVGEKLHRTSRVVDNSHSDLKEKCSLNQDSSENSLESNSKLTKKFNMEDEDSKASSASVTTKITIYNGLKVTSTNSTDTSMESNEQPKSLFSWCETKTKENVDGKENISQNRNNICRECNEEQFVCDIQDKRQNKHVTNSEGIPLPPSEIILMNQQTCVEETNNSGLKSQRNENGVTAIEMTPNYSLGCAASSNVNDPKLNSNQAADSNFFEITDGNEKKEYQTCFGKNAIWKKHVIMTRWNEMKKIAAYDYETGKILKLAIPYTLGAMLEAVFDMIYLGLIGNFMGTRALSAYAVVETMLEASDEFIGGVIDAGTTVISHCVGTGNNYLAGQYVQMSALLYILALIPTAILWWYFMYDIILWFGLDEEIAALGHAYTGIALISEAIDGIGSTFETFLEVTDHEIFSLVLGLVADAISVVIFIVLVGRNDNELNLTTIAYLDLAVTFVYTVLIIWIPIYKGWIKEFLNGIFFNISLKNIPALKNILITALPLSLGSLIAYGEWELLTIFAAHLGPAELASWLILGSIWEIFEVTTEAIGDTAEVRVGYYLGKGNPEMARFSANKTLLWGTCASIFITIIFFSIGDYVPLWFTTDETIQNMIRMTIPYVSIGNVTMTFGMICWSILGAQGRYNLATFILLLTSWLLVLPIAAVFTYMWRLNLKGLVSSLVFGYSATASCMAIVILVSDWEKCSDKIIAINAINGFNEYSDSESESKSKLSESRRSSYSSSSQSVNLSTRDPQHQLINELSEVLNKMV